MKPLALVPRFPSKLPACWTMLPQRLYAFPGLVDGLAWRLFAVFRPVKVTGCSDLALSSWPLALINLATAVPVVLRSRRERCCAQVVGTSPALVSKPDASEDGA